MSLLSRTVLAATLLTGPALAKPQMIVAAVGASQTFGQRAKVGSTVRKDEPDDGQAEAIRG